MTYVHKPSMMEWLSAGPLPFVHKIRRAEVHLNSLNTEIRKFIKNHPCGARQYVQSEEGSTKRWVWYADIDTYPPVHEWGVIIGDFVHNLRSALDNLIYCSVAATTHRTPRRTEFPIYKTEEKYRSNGLVRIEGINPDAETLIERLQPYHRGQEFRLHPLWMLHELSNWDKHNIVNICSWAICDPIFQLVGATDDVLVYSQQVIQSGEPIQHGSVLADIKFSVIRAGGKVDIRKDFRFDVAFFEAGPTSGGFVIPRLTELINFVREEIVGKLELLLYSEFKKRPNHQKSPSTGTR